MHQDHNIPWKVLANNFAILPNPVRPHDPFPGSDFYPLNKPHQAKDFEYFTQALIKTIREFATTEQLKYPSSSSQPPSPTHRNQSKRTTAASSPSTDNSKVFSDEVLEQHQSRNINNPYTPSSHTDMTKDDQSIHFWIQRAAPRVVSPPPPLTASVQSGTTILNKKKSQPLPTTDQSTYKPRYDTGALDLASVVKYLLIDNQMQSLLTLARHPLIPIKDLYHLSWGHSFGWSRLLEYALEAYIFFNVLAEFPEVCKVSSEGEDNNEGYLKRLTISERLCWHLVSTCDGDAQIAVHLPYLIQSTKTDDAAAGSTTKPYILRGGRLELCNMFSDLKLLHQYMKDCFAVMYRSEVLARECGMSDKEIGWEQEIAYALRNFHVQHWHRSVSGKDGQDSYELVFEKPR